MPRPRSTVDDLLFSPLSPSALLRGERALDDVEANELAAGRIATVALARAGALEAPNAASDARPKELRARLMTSLTRGGRYGIFTDRIARLFDLPADKALEYMRRIEDPTQFRPFPADGIEMLPLRPGPRVAGAVAAFGRLRPGAKFPHHAHMGEETTIVLDGGFLDVSGEEVWRGDEMVKGSGSEHDFVVLEGGDCIAAVLAMGGVDFR
jgi:hypothetical protein